MSFALLLGLFSSPSVSSMKLARNFPCTLVLTYMFGVMMEMQCFHLDFSP